LKKIGITDPDNYVKTLFQNQTVQYLSSSCFAGYFLDSIESEIEDSLTRNGYSDLSVNKRIIRNCFLILIVLKFKIIASFTINY
jgi:hypothetical protein